MKVEKFREIKKGKNILSKIKNLYFFNGNYCDAYLSEWNDEFVIQLNGKYGENKKKLILTNIHIKFLLEKMRENKSQNEDYGFGIKDREGVKIETGKLIKGKPEIVFYKLYIENKVMKGKEKSIYPFAIYIKSNYIKMSIDRDSFMMFLIQAQEILYNLKHNIGTIDIKAIYDLDKKVTIYEKPSKKDNSTKETKNVIQEERKNEKINNEDINKKNVSHKELKPKVIDENKILTQNEKINIAQFKIKGLTVIEIINGLKGKNKPEVEKSLNFLIEKTTMNKDELQYIKSKICA